MPPITTSPINKKSRRGLFFLLFILALVLLVAYALIAVKKTDTTPLTSLSKSEKQILMDQFRITPTSITTSEKKMIAENLSTEKQKPLSTTDKSAIVSQFQQ